ncbi:MAG: hypothetical protein FJ125_05915, partial [Deltaproteobacteria bacterium]|nr:hypothetical protein [Deltaproteobacteria bacterium]
MVGDERHWLPVLLLGLVLCAPGCPAGASRQAVQQQQQQQAQQREERRNVGELLRQVQEEESHWRVLIAEQRRSREQLMSLPGSSGLGLAQKKLQHLAQQAGLLSMDLRSHASGSRTPLVSSHSLALVAEGTFLQALQLLGRVEAAAPLLCVHEFSLIRIRIGTGGEPDRFRLETVVAAHTREALPPPATPLPRMGEIPLETEAALRMLTSRLLMVQGAVDSARREQELLAQGLGLVDSQRVPIRSIFGPLSRLLREVELTAISARQRLVRLQGTAPDDEAVRRLRRALAEAHPFLRPHEDVVLERQPSHPGWQTSFTLSCTIEGRKLESTTGAAPAAAPLQPPQLEEPPPPAPVVAPEPAAPPPPAPVVAPEPAAPPPAPVVAPEP